MSLNHYSVTHTLPYGPGGTCHLSLLCLILVVQGSVFVACFQGVFSCVIVALPVCHLCFACLTCERAVEAIMTRIIYFLFRIVTFSSNTKLKYYAYCLEPHFISLYHMVISKWKFKIRSHWVNINITKTCLYNFDPLKPQFYIVKLRFTG